MTFTLSRRAFTVGAALLPMACSPSGSGAPKDQKSGNAAKSSGSASSSLSLATNPLVKQRADAQIFKHEDGNYYMTASVPEYDRLILRRSPTLAGLANAEERVLWRHLESGPMSGFIWAPELHLVDDKWIMYFAAGPSGGGEDVFRIRTYAIICDGPDPMAGNWTVLGQFEAPWDSFNLDSTIYTHRGTRYFIWAQREPGIETNSNMYIAPLASPLKLAKPAVRLTVPTLDWEIRGFKVNEAAALIENDGKLFMTYSASATDSRYCLGMLSIDADADLMDAKAWTKSPEPVFTTNVETGVYGPGHNSFTVDEQGRPVLVYHGRDYEEIEGDPLFNPDRHTRIQRLYFKPDGTPDFGVPVGNGPLPERLTTSDGGTMLVHDGERLSAGTGPLPNTQFRSVKGEGDLVSISPILLRDHALTIQEGDTVGLAPSPEGTTAPAASQFKRVSLQGGKAVRFESVAQPGKAVGAVDGKTALVPTDDSRAIWNID